MHTNFPVIFYIRGRFCSTMENCKLRVTEKKKSRSISGLSVVLSGFEPPTHGFSVRCSTN